MNNISDVPKTLLKCDQLGEVPGPFTMSFGFELESLARSIEKFGLINLPCVTRSTSGRMDLVIGFRRVCAVKSLGWKKIPCRDLSSLNSTPLDLLHLNLQDNLHTREFNVVEKGMILNRLAPHVGNEALLNHYMPLLHLSENQATLGALLRIENLDLPLREALAKEQVSVRSLWRILELEPESFSVLINGITNIKLNSNQQSQFIEYTTDISIKEGKGIKDLLDEEPFRKILQEEKINRPQRAKLLITSLRGRRFPSLTQSEKTFKEKISNLGLPDGAQIKHPPFFEGSDFRLEIGFRDGSSLLKKIESIGKLKALEGIGLDDK